MVVTNVNKRFKRNEWKELSVVLVFVMKMIDHEGRRPQGRLEVKKNIF